VSDQVRKPNLFLEVSPHVEVRDSSPKKFSKFGSTVVLKCIRL